MAKNASVLVIGAGPTGLAAAIELHRRGVAVRIVDQDPDAMKESRAVGVNPRTLELLEPSGATERLVAAGVRLRGMKIVGDGRTRAELDISRLRHRFNFMLALPQDRTEAILTEILAEAGVTVERGVACTSVVAHAGHAEARLGQQEVTADWLLGADGAHSTVRKAMGIDFPGEPYPFQWSLADVDLDGDAEPDRGELRLDVGRPVLLRLPIAPGRHRLIANGADVMGLVPASWKPGAVHWMSHFKVSHRQARSLGDGRVRLIGDAAHIHSPAGARGMNLGIEDAATVAEAIARGDLGGWNAGRHVRAAQVIRESDAMQRMATADGVLARRIVPAVVGLVLGIPPLHDRVLRAVAGLA